MMNNNAISMIIPTYNEAENLFGLIDMIKNLLKSLPNLNLEFIIVDGYSNDDSYTLLQNWRAELFPYLKFYQCPKGRGKQLTYGAKMASHSTFLFLHADTIIAADYLEEIAALPLGDMAWGCGKLAFADDKKIFRLIEKCSQLRAKYLHACFGDQGIFATKNLYWQAGGFQDIAIMEDLFFCKTAKKLAKPTILKSTVTTSSRRYHQYGIYKTIYKMQMVKLLYSLGKQPQQLKEYYYNGLTTDTNSEN